MFTHLQIHSCYSLLYGSRSISDIVCSAKDIGLEALALTDINNLYGIHPFIETCHEHGIRPIIGSEIRSGQERAVALVKTREGFSNLTRLITLRMKGDGFNLADSLARHSDGIVILSDSPALLERLRREDADLYAMITPDSQRAHLAAQKLGLPCAASCDVTFIDEKDIHIHRALRAISKKGSLANIKDCECAPENSYLFSPEQAKKIFLEFPEALENTEKIAARCIYNTLFNGFIFPDYKGLSKGDSASLLRTRTLEGAEIRYGELSESVMERIDFELGIIETKNFSRYFLVVADIVKHASHICGRGSAAASIVSYCLGITNVDPIRHNLYFERFLNPERSDPPDIDIDFAWDERDAIIEHVMKTQGEEFSAMVCTHVHFQERSAVREVARVYGIPENEISGFEKHIFRRSRAEHGHDEIDDTWREILLTAERIREFPRHLGVHVGGLVISPDPMSNHVPVEKAPKGVPVITWDKDDAEKAGLVKIDLLGNRSLAVVRDALINLRENGVCIDPNAWDPISDERTVDLIARGNTMGVFYVESPAMRQLQKKTGAGDFEHLVIHSSIIRPAANRFISEYVKRLKGKPYKPLHPRLDHILRETYGIMCYQEDVSKTAVALAGFTSAEADGLRKILTKKNRATRLREYREKFFMNASENGVPDGSIREIWAMIESFDGYSFCKPHSASYAMVSFRSAYLKAHHPAEFMAAVLSNGGGYYTAQAYISESRRMGLKVLQPDINESRAAYYGGNGCIRVGFMAISEIRRCTVLSLLDERQKNGKFKSLQDLLNRVDIPPSDAQSLVSSGALDSIAGGKNRQEQMRSMLLGINKTDLKAEKNGSLFECEEKQISPGRGHSRIEQLKQEYKSLGFLCGAHPLCFWGDKIKLYKRIRAIDIPKYAGRDISVIGWLITRKTILTANGSPMEFVSFEDETDIYETVLFPKAYLEHGNSLDESNPFLITGRVENDMGAVYINVKRLEKIKNHDMP